MDTCGICGKKVRPGEIYCPACLKKMAPRREPVHNLVVVARPIPKPKPSPKPTPTPRSEDSWYRVVLREWWHNILRAHGSYRCYAFFLCLPADKAAIEYLTDYGKELDLLSGDNCLVISLSESNFKLAGFDEEVWTAAVNEQVSEGYSLTVASLFEIKFTEMPCFVLYEDIRSPRRIVFSLKGLSSEQIASQMRLIFSVIQQAVSENKKPIDQLEKHQKSAEVQKTIQTVKGKVSDFAGKTFEAAVEAWIETVIN